MAGAWHSSAPSERATRRLVRSCDISHRAHAAPPQCQPRAHAASRLNLRRAGERCGPAAAAARDVHCAAAATVAVPPTRPAQPIAADIWQSYEKNGCPPTFLTTPGRIVAIGDIHGDLSKAITCLELAGVLTQRNERPVWCGGNTIVVQLGDVLDRGDQEIGTLLLLQELGRQARGAGGAVIMLNGNHEAMNLIGNFRFATMGGMREAAAAAGIRGDALANPAALAQGRRRLYAPGGPIARMLAANPTILKINDTLFAHGGVLPQHLEYGMERLNAEVSAWVRGSVATSAKDAAQMMAMGNSRSVMWNRMFGAESFKSRAAGYVGAMLEDVLAAVGCRQLIIGHSVQAEGANVQFDGRLWRLDVGMSCGVLNAAPQVLEIFRDPLGNTVNRLLTAVPLARDVAPIGVPYCRLRW